MESAKRVALNTGFLYGKMLITMFISLFSTRIILDALGVEDFGIFNLVAGITMMLTFLNGAMTVSTQRYLSFYLGANQLNKQKAVFASSVILHLVIGAIVVIILEILGFFMFEGGLNIPDERVGTAKIVYQFMVISTFFTMNAVPYDATINAHENMLFDAISGVFESVMKLGIAFGLIYTSSDKLILYGLLIAALTILIRLIKSFYCVRKYEECKVNWKTSFDKDLFKEMISFAGWNLFGSFCGVVRNQGLAVVLNVFAGVIVNATYGIANQVNSQVSAFSANIIRAINPQIVKSEGGGDRNRMLKLTMLSCKLSFFLLAFFAIPLIVEMHYVLNIWLKEVPEAGVIFCQLILILSLVKQLTNALMIALQSVGNIKWYQIVVGSLLLLNLPLAIILMKMGFPPYSVLVGGIVLEIIAGWARIMFAHKLTGLEIKVFLNKTVFNSLISILLASAIAFIPQYFMEESFVRLLISGAASSIFIILFGRIFGITNDEYEKLKAIISSVKKSIGNKLKK
jgi:O-antigen/teichoic acid export membrane protein